MTRNGIPVDHLQGFIDGMRARPEAGMLTVCTSHRWDDGFAVDSRCETLAQAGEVQTRTHHIVRTDWPPPLATDTGMTPGAESILAAVGACVATTCVARAALAGITLDAVEVTTQGRVDLRGLFEVDGVAPRFSEIEVRLRVSADADDATLEALVEGTGRTSPAVDSLANPVPVRLKLERLAPVGADA